MAYAGGVDGGGEELLTNNRYDLLPQHGNDDLDLDLARYMEVSHVGKKRAAEETSSDDDVGGRLDTRSNEQIKNKTKKDRKDNVPRDVDLTLGSSIKVDKMDEVELNRPRQVSPRPNLGSEKEENINFGNVIIVQNVVEDVGLPIRSLRFKRQVEASEFAKAGIINIKTASRIGGIAIEVRDRKLVPELIKIRKLGDLNVKCKIPRLNATRTGVLGPVDMEATVEEVEDELREQNIKFEKVERLYKGKKDNKVLTAFFKIEFIGRELPESIEFGLGMARVKPYSRRILQCFKCKKIGHSANFCKSKKLCCPKCGENHLIKDCSSNNMKCVNCGKEHMAWSWDCNVVKRAKEIQTIQDDMWVPFDVAKTIYEAENIGNRENGLKYSQVVKNGGGNNSNNGNGVLKVRSNDRNGEVTNDLQSKISGISKSEGSISDKGECVCLLKNKSGVSESELLDKVDSVMKDVANKVCKLFIKIISVLSLDESVVEKQSRTIDIIEEVFEMSIPSNLKEAVDLLKKTGSSKEVVGTGKESGFQKNKNLKTTSVKDKVSCTLDTDRLDMTDSVVEPSTSKGNTGKAKVSRDCGRGRGRSGVANS